MDLCDAQGSDAGYFTDTMDLCEPQSEWEAGGSDTDSQKSSTRYRKGLGRLRDSSWEYEKPWHFKHGGGLEHMPPDQALPHLLPPRLPHLLPPRHIVTLPNTLPLGKGKGVEGESFADAVWDATACRASVLRELKVFHNTRERLENARGAMLVQTAEKVMSRWLNLALSVPFASWSASLLEKKRLVRAAEQVIMRWEKLSLFVHFARWLRYVGMESPTDLRSKSSTGEERGKEEDRVNRLQDSDFGGDNRCVDDVFKRRSK
jgi:hypothetical protein